MDKFGVHQTAKPSVKHASERVSHCPLCGSNTQQHGAVVLCPTHGSKPFEKNERED